jgi:hypothetical protein
VKATFQVSSVRKPPRADQSSNIDRTTTVGLLVEDQRAVLTDLLARAVLGGG